MQYEIEKIRYNWNAYDNCFSFTKKENCSPNIFFSFSKPEGFSYTAGQYVSLELIHPKETDSKGTMREFSLSSSPYEKNLSIATRLRSTAFKRIVNTLPIGETLSLKGPFGDMVLHQDVKIPAVFLTGGIGITPFISMIKQMIYEHSQRQLYLFLTNQDRESAVFVEEIKKLAQTNTNVHFIPTFTREKSGFWIGETGYITHTMLQKYIPDLMHPYYYIAGKPELVWYLREILEKAGIHDKKIRGEEFSGY